MTPILKVKMQVKFDFFLEWLGWKNRFQQKGYIKPEKLNEDQKEMIKSWVDDNAGIPLRTMVTIVQKETDISVVKKLLQSFREDQFIFIDECGVNISMRTSHRMSKMGSPAIRVVQNLQTSNIEQATIVIDNVSLHHCEAISLQISEAGHIILFISPYLPFMNPIENMFPKWKREIRNMKSENSEE
ncbi:hypothetical protein RF11_13073 [Thelohanellus kitauei]|uniref:Tc1-like transposase DDE domain-containing protein n=1 Tax=Thelohanellus kitauei TaxID=669202 RepID=A0A0C2N7E5_THEKT|nr:hypothetical protein RF11_13073 [Thelohanellus kitauei]